MALQSSEGSLPKLEKRQIKAKRLLSKIKRSMKPKNIQWKIYLFKIFSKNIRIFNLTLEYTSEYHKT